MFQHVVKCITAGEPSLSRKLISLSLAIARNLKFRHMHPFVQIQVVMLRLCYVSKLSDEYHRKRQTGFQFIFFNSIAAS